MRPVGQGSGRGWIHPHTRDQSNRRLMETNVYGAQLVGELWHLWLENWWTEESCRCVCHKRLCKHLNIDLIQRFANSRIAKDEMEIDNLKFLPRKFLGCWYAKCEFPTQNDCGCVLLNKLKNDLPQNLQRLLRIHFEAYLPFTKCGGNSYHMKGEAIYGATWG